MEWSSSSRLHPRVAFVFIMGYIVSITTVPAMSNRRSVNGQKSRALGSATGLRGPCAMRENMPEVVAELVAEFNQILENLQLPQDALAARQRVEKLTQRGCDEKFVLRVSYLYAYTANAFKKNAKDEAGTPSSSRLIALPGLGMSRRDVANHVRDTRHVARQIQRFLAVSGVNYFFRKPGKDQRTLLTADELSSLPKALERYCRFAVEVGQACSIPREKRLQRDRFLCSLVVYVKVSPGKPHWESLLDIINAWNLVTIQDVTTLMSQFKRANRPDQLPLFWPRSQSGAGFGTQT